MIISSTVHGHKTKCHQTNYVNHTSTIAIKFVFKVSKVLLKVLDGIFTNAF